MWAPPGLRLVPRSAERDQGCGEGSPSEDPQGDPQAGAVCRLGCQGLFLGLVPLLVPVNTRLGSPTGEALVPERQTPRGSVRRPGGAVLQGHVGEAPALPVTQRSEDAADGVLSLDGYMLGGCQSLQPLPGGQARAQLTFTEPGARLPSPPPPPEGTLSSLGRLPLGLSRESWGSTGSDENKTADGSTGAGAEAPLATPGVGRCLLEPPPHISNAAGQRGRHHGCSSPSREEFPLLRAHPSARVAALEHRGGGPGGGTQACAA